MGQQIIAGGLQYAPQTAAQLGDFDVDGSLNGTGNVMLFAANDSSGSQIVYADDAPTDPAVFIYSDGFLTCSAVTVYDVLLRSGLDDLMLVSSGGTAVGTIIGNGGSAYISSGGRMEASEINSKGSLIIGDGGRAESSVVNNRGTVYVSSGGCAADTVLNRGSMFVSSGGTADRTTVNSSGFLHVSSGGTATNVVWTPCVGFVSAADGAVVRYVSSYSGVYCGSNNRLLSHYEGNTVLTGMQVSGTMYVMNDGRVESTTAEWGSVFVSSGGAAHDTVINTRGSICVYSGSIVERLTINANGAALLSSGGRVTDITINSSGNMDVFNGGLASGGVVNYGGCMEVSSGGAAERIEIDGGLMRISSGGVASAAEVSSGGSMLVLEGGSAVQIVENGGCVTVNGNGNVTFASNTISGITLADAMMTVHSNTVAENTVISSGGSLRLHSGGVASGTVVSSGGYMYIYSGGVHRGGLEIVSGAMVSVALSGAVIDFSIAGRSTSDEFLINNLSLISGVPDYTITVAANQATGTYNLAQGAEYFTGTISIGDGSVTYGELFANGSVVYNNTTYSLNKVNGNLTLTVDRDAVIGNLQGNADGVSWNGTGSGFTVSYSKDDFAGSLQIFTAASAVDTYGMPGGTYQWKVTDEYGESSVGNDIVSENSTVPQKLISDADGSPDLFFARSGSSWSIGYSAQHAGTGELVSLDGKNRIEDVFCGAAAANILVLTDDANGDALFLDDIYSAFGDQARLSLIYEIRAGAGDDIVDLTSNKYTFPGVDITVYGGDGNDTIWTNSLNSTLYGDAGNDRIVGGAGNDIIIGGAGNDSLCGNGGEDIFTFGGNWGNDTVEQLAGGKVTLYFENGSISNWDAATGIYSDGTNSVTVTGTGDITLKFGNDETLPAGAFLDAASGKIFEDKDSGMLA